MRAAWPAAGAADAFFQLRNQPFEMFFRGLVLFDDDDPADPFVAGQRCDVFPCRQYSSIGSQRFAHVIGHVMDGACRNALLRHVCLFLRAVSAEDETCAAQARMPNCSMWTSVSTATALSVTVTFMVPDESGSLKRINCPARVQDIRRIGRKLL